MQLIINSKDLEKDNIYISLSIKKKIILKPLPNIKKKFCSSLCCIFYNEYNIKCNKCNNK